MTKRTGMLLGLAVLFVTAAVERTDAACCRASCIGPVPWVACFADTTSCNTLQCVGGGSTSLAVDPTATCGQGIVFGSCPPTETNACSDAVNNDGWVDGFTDLADPDCGNQPPAAAPAAGPLGVAGIVAALVGIAALRIRRT